MFNLNSKFIFQFQVMFLTILSFKFGKFNLGKPQLALVVIVAYYAYNQRGTYQL